MVEKTAVTGFHLEHKKVYLYDINSAYPYAMTQIPSFLNCKYIVKDGKNIKVDNKLEGIYRINALSTCLFNSTFDHDFTPLKQLNNIWITSYELKSLLNYGCIKKLKINAAILIVPQTKENPLSDYAKKYYSLKQTTPKNSALYPFYKITMLNSLYGKFIERRYDESLDYSLRGPNYNPAIATLITGFTRAQLHNMEHIGEALHSATDSVFTYKKMETSEELGGVSLEGYGKLQMFRTKCYMFWSKEKPTGKEIIKDKEGMYLFKYAYHGFHGDIKQLINLWNTRGRPQPSSFNGEKLKKNQYLYKKMPTSKEFFIRKKSKLKLFGMNDLIATLNIDWRNLQ